MGCMSLALLWSRKLAPFSQPISCKTKANDDLVARVFPRFRQFVYSQLNSHWLFRVFSFLLISGCYNFDLVLLDLSAGFDSSD